LHGRANFNDRRVEMANRREEAFLSARRKKNLKNRQFSGIKDYCTLRLKKLIWLAGATKFSLGFNFGDGGYLINVCIDNFEG
jgi:hypothetical protein